jgi:hypothetical protein
MVSYCYARLAPNPHGKQGSTFPWCQVVRRFDGGDEIIELDFLRNAAMANELAERANLGRHISP